MPKRTTGRYERTTVGGEKVAAFVPHALPPTAPVLTVASVMKLVETTKPTAGRAIGLLVAAGVLVETTGRKRDRSFVYQGYLDRLRVGTELDELAAGPSRSSRARGTSLRDG
jgi:hypothetical protein